MIGRLHHLIIDCPDPLALATFYAGLLGQPITYRSEDLTAATRVPGRQDRAGPFAEPAGGKWAIAEIAARHLAPALEKMADP